MKEYKPYTYNITPAIRDFIKNNSELILVPNKGIVGYNHIIRQGASKRSITSDIAFYLLISDLNSICIKLSQELNVELSESKLCALISYFHATKIEPNRIDFTLLNEGKYNLFGEKVFLNTYHDYLLTSRKAKSLRRLEYKLWTNDDGIYLNSKISNY